jgi:lipopolysaccharide export system permease protein
MTFIHLWQRYFLREILKVFFLFLLCFFFLYALIDYSMHMQEILKNKRISLTDLLYYYGMLFSKRCDLLLPLSLLISSVKVLTSLNRRNELLALQTAGIPLHVLTRPFFFVGLLCMGVSYFNFEVISPQSLTYIDRFEKKYLKNKKAKKTVYTSVHALPLEDGSRLIYQNYDEEAKEFFDVFWILSPDEIYHMKTLLLNEGSPQGAFVDLIKRNEKGALEKKESYDHYFFKNLTLNFNLKNHFGKLMENRSISELLQMTLKKTPLFYDNRSSAYTHLYFKIVMPCLPVLVLIGVIPFCVRSMRNLPTFLIFSFTIFGYITFFTVMDACVILGETQVVNPFWAIFSLPIAFFTIFGIRFLRFCLRST